MDLDAVTVNIRPRNSWEAIDAGFMLARHWYGKLCLLWLLAASPFLLLLFGCSFFLPTEMIKWFVLLFWLFKPLYELPILNWVSKALFGEQASVRCTLGEVRKKLSFRQFFTLFISRFSHLRSFSMPVLHLEGLVGKPRKERLSLLAKNSETAFFLTGGGFCIELLMTFSFIVILFWLLPESLRQMDFGRFVFKSGNWILLMSYIISCAIFAPFYTCSGFLMYISRRVELEAWNIEIGFKRMGQRLSRLKKGIIRNATVAVLLFAISLSSLSGFACAETPDPSVAKETIAKVLKGKDFGQKVKKYYWVPKKNEPVEKDSAWAKLWGKAIKALIQFLEEAAPFLAKYGKILLWCCTGIIIAYLLLKYSRLREWLNGRFSARPKTYTPPAVMFGMDLRPESLPEDIGASCLALIEKGRKREALSLLYRGTLSRLVNLHSLEIHASFTEAECCDTVRNHRPETEGTFFSALTGLWACLAYAHRNPAGEDCRRLVSEWNKLYGVQV